MYCANPVLSTRTLTFVKRGEQSDYIAVDCIGRACDVLSGVVLPLTDWRSQVEYRRPTTVDRDEVA